MVNDAVQRAGEGPYQVAERLLGGKADAKTVMALTQVLKQQLIENTDSKTYQEAVSKMEVGHQFFTCEKLESIRQKVKASGNEELLKIFGEPQPVKEEVKAEVNEEEKKEEKVTPTNFRVPFHAW